MQQNQQPTVEQLQAELDRIKAANIAFIKKVAYLREHQKQYFKTRDHEILKLCTALEAGIDNYLKRCFDRLDQIEFEQASQAVAEKIDGVQVPNE